MWSCLCHACAIGSIFGVSALTFGKWQLVASLGAVVFRTIGGPTILSSILRTPGRNTPPPRPARPPLPARIAQANDCPLVPCNLAAFIMIFCGGQEPIQTTHAQPQTDMCVCQPDAG